MRGTINQLLVELDSVDSGNEGVFVLAATNHPWNVDSALLRPGRLDRSVLVLPPDPPARAAIIRYHLRDRPVAGAALAADPRGLSPDAALAAVWAALATRTLRRMRPTARGYLLRHVLRQRATEPTLGGMVI
jgi:SpoVK/Ycf46/Vps4 family AAA+-type ATPase